MPATQEQLDELQLRIHRRDIAEKALNASGSAVNFADVTMRCVRDLLVVSESTSDMETAAKLIIDIGSVLLRAKGMHARHVNEAEVARRLVDEWRALVDSAAKEPERPCEEGCVLHGGRHEGPCLKPTAAVR